MEQRIKWLICFFIFCFLAIFGKLFYWQVINRRSLLTLAANQYRTSLEIPASRGKIFSKDNFPLVLNQKSYLLFVNPKQLKISANELIEKIRTVVKKDQFNPQAIANKELLWLPLAKGLTEEEKEKIEGLNISGLGFEGKEKRYYSESSMSASLLGFVGEDEKGGEKGYFGLEGYYNNEISGKSGSHFFEQDALGRPLPLVEETLEEPIVGRNLLLYLDRPLQFLVEGHLQKGIKKYSAASGLAVIMNPKDGEILSMASFPSYDPASYYLYDQQLYRNPVISSSFEPGSIFKVVLMAAAIDAGVVKADEKCPICNGPRKIGEYTIRTWNDKYYPDSSMTEVIIHSDNIGMTYVSQKLGVEKFYNYLEKFGFGQRTGIDLQGEISPGLRSKENWREIDLATASFGQGIAATPIQILNAVSAIANKGEFYQPQVVSKIFEDSHMVEIKPVEKGRPISSEAARIVTEMMVAAVEKGEAKWAKPKGYQIAGKTGTAQIPIAGHYDPEKTVASFIGFAPVDNPRFVMLVALREPKSSPWGSETAAPLWFDIAKDIFKLWGIPRD